MPPLSLCKRKSDSECFALMIKNGETLSPFQISEISQRNELTPIFVTFSTDRPLDVSRLYARALGAPLFIPRSAGAASEILSSCNFSICESEESAILSISARVPVYLSASSPECRSFAARLCSVGVSQEVIIPYTKNRTGAISTRRPQEKELARAAEVIRSVIF